MTVRPVGRRFPGRAAGRALLALGLLVGGVTFAWSTPTAAHAAGCTTPEVAVLVDLSHWGGSERVGCVGWSSSMTGVSALAGAGFAPTGTRQYGLAFICRIDGYPTAGAPDHESCDSTPPATKYWSYWHANSGQSSWTYSTLGAASYHPHAGSVDAWTFGAGTAPPVAPSAVLPGAAPAPTSHEPTTKPPATVASTHRSTTPSTRRSASVEPTSPSTPSSGEASSTSGAPATTSSPGTAKPSTTATASTGTTSAPARSSAPTSTGAASINLGRTPVIVENSSPAGLASKPASGSPWASIAGVVVVATLAAGGGFYAWRRREPRSHG